MISGQIRAQEATETRTVTTAASLPGATSLPVEEPAGFLSAVSVRVDDITTGQSNVFPLGGVDTEGDVLTFDAPLPVAISEGSFVLAVTANNVPVVDHFVTVESSDGGQFRPQISAEKGRVFGSELVGANAILSDDGEWVEHVTDVPARTVTNYLRAIMGTNVSIPNGSAVDKIPTAWTVVPYVGFANVGEGITYDGFTGVAKVPRDGLYNIHARAVFDANATGARALRVVAVTYVGEVPSEWHLITPSSTFWPAHLAISLSTRLAAGEGLRVEVWQNSGAALPLLGGYSPARTTLNITHGGP